MRKKSLKNIQNELKITAQSIDTYLDNNVFSKDESLRVLYESMRYSLLDAGKRIRPFIVISMAQSLGADIEKAMPFAAAIEMIHTYSLIHDDLPCMDDDDMRRGKPSNHKAFGEDIALLAGDALLTLAFETVACADLPSDIRIQAVRCLSEAAGADGMIGGQVLDLEAEKISPDEARLNKIYSLKTGALLRASARLGCLAASVTDKAILDKADEYAKGIGTSFQIIDDLLDRYGDEKLLGKPVGSDEKNGKVTYLSFYDYSSAKSIAQSLTQSAIDAISDFPKNENLVELANFLLNREA